MYVKDSAQAGVQCLISLAIANSRPCHTMQMDVILICYSTENAVHTTENGPLTQGLFCLYLLRQIERDRQLARD
jgi:hypothetical protein